jgi:hypothetical protein
MQLNASLAAGKGIAPVASIRALPGRIMVDVRAIPKVRAPRQKSTRGPMGSLVSKPLEDLFPSLDREEFFSRNMMLKLYSLRLS